MKFARTKSLKIYAGPEISTIDFRKQCSDAARDQLNKELEDLKFRINKKMDSLEDKLEKEERDVKSAETKLEQRRIEEMGTHGELLLIVNFKKEKINFLLPHEKTYDNPGKILP